jgi:hypothetical protein
MTQHFGPCFAPRSNAQPPASTKASSSRASPVREKEIKYPGIIFHLDEESEDIVRAFTLVATGLEGSDAVRKVVAKLRNGEAGEWGVWDDVMGLKGTITHCEIHVCLSFFVRPLHR